MEKVRKAAENNNIIQQAALKKAELHNKSLEASIDQKVDGIYKHFNLLWLIYVSMKLQSEDQKQNFSVIYTKFLARFFFSLKKFILI